MIERERGNGDAISYVENKLQIFRYLPSTPMIFLLKHLAYLYAEDGQSAEAHRCLREILNAEPVLRVDDKGEEQKLRSEASHALASLSVPAHDVETSPQTKLQKKALASIVVAWWAYYFWVGYLAPLQLSWGCKLVPELRDRT